VSDPLDELTARLEQTAARLREGDLEPEQAASVVDDCARKAGEAAAELERQVRAAGDAPGPGQASLLE
jgi:polyhydroxyalkanoate synthesis regulator phasin